MGNTTLQKSDYKTIVDQFSQIPIDGFFDGISKCLANLLDVDCVIMSKCSPSCVDQLFATSIFCDGTFSQPFRYSIFDAPCETMMAGKPYHFYGDLVKQYPNAAFLEGQQFVHYLGFPLLDCDSKHVGYIAIFHRRKIENVDRVMWVLKIASQRTVRELVRSKSVVKMKRLNEGLRLPSGPMFYRELATIITSHFAIDAAFIAHLRNEDSNVMQLKALSGTGVSNVTQCAVFECDSEFSMFHYTEGAMRYLPQARALMKIEFQAAIVLPLRDQTGKIIGFIGALSTYKLANTDSIIAMLESFSSRTEMELEHQTREHKLKYFNAILSATDDLMSFVDHNYHYRALNQAHCNLYGKDINELINRPVASFHTDEMYNTDLKPCLELALAGETNTAEIIRKNDSGEHTYFHGRHHPYVDADGKIVGVVVSARDVTELKKVQMALAVSEERWNILYNKTPSMFFTIDKQFVINSVNTFGANKLGYQVDELVNESYLMLYSMDDRSVAVEHLNQCFTQPNELHEWEIRQVRSKGRSLWVKQTAQVVNVPGDGNRLFIAAEDISEKHRLSQKLSYQATHDSLTGLTNRLEFDRSLEKLAEKKSEEPQQTHILCYIDLDRFKVINDSCGHLAGDELLCNIADVLSENVRKSDVLARIGGDEFAILMEDCTLDKAKVIAESIRVAINDYVLVWKDRNYQVGASIGLTIFNLQTDSIAETLSAADEACYAAKAGGRNQIFVYASSEDDKGQQRTELKLLANIKQAIKEDRFEMFAQPIYGVEDLVKAKSYELLLRLSTEGEYVDAGKLFQIAQQHQLITRIDEWVIAYGFEWLANEGRNVAMDYCSINISGTSAGDAEFLEYVLYQLNKHQLNGESICFEITETATMSNLIGVINFMTELRKYGCLFTLDNFGSGISSFNHMKNFAFDQVKITKEYTTGLMKSDIDRAMVEAIVGVCHAMGKKAVAGAVENQETYQYLADIKIDCIQGVYSGKPVPILTIR